MLRRTRLCHFVSSINALFYGTFTTGGSMTTLVKKGGLISWVRVRVRVTQLYPPARAVEL